MRWRLLWENIHEQRFRSQSPVDSPHVGPLPPHFLDSPSKFICIRCADGVRSGEAHLLPRGPGSLAQISSVNQMPCALDRQKQTWNSFSGSQNMTRASFWNWKPGSRSSSLGFAIMHGNHLSPGIEEEEEGAQSAFVLSSLWVSYSVPILYTCCYYC